MLIYQNLGADFCLPKSGYRSQKRPVLSPALKRTNNIVWFLAHLFDFSPSVVHLTLFLLFFIIQKRLSHSNTHVENQNTKRRMETKNIPYFWFWINDVGGLIERRLVLGFLWRRLVLWVKIPLTLASHILVVIFVVE